MRKKLLAFALALTLVVSLCPATLAAGPLQASEANTNVEKLLANLQTRSGFLSGEKPSYADECFTFAKRVFKELFGYDTNTLYYHGELKGASPNLVRVGRCFVAKSGCNVDHSSGVDSTTITADTVKALLSKAKCGDILQTTRFVSSNTEGCSVGRPHTMIVQQVKSNSVVVYEANWVKDTIGYREITFKDFASKYDHVITVYRANNYDKVNGSSSGSTTVTDNGPCIYPTTEPGQNLPQGKPFYFKGTITSVSKVTSATISILSADGKTTLQTKTITPNTATVDIATSGLDALKFGQLSPGSYLFYLTATSQSGKTSTWQKGFSIAGSTPTPAAPAPATPAPAASTLKISLTTEPDSRHVYHTPFSLEGTITSNYNITYTYAAVKDRETGRAYLTRDDSPLVTTYNVKTSILNDLHLDEFATGSYTLEIIAKDTSGKEARWQKDFSILQQAQSTKPQEPADTTYTLTINYYIDNKLVFTDRSPGGNGDVCHIYTMPDAYHGYSFWGSSTTSIGLFATELWIPGLSENSTIDLYANSDGSKPDRFLNSYEVTVVSVDEAGTVLGGTSISIVEGDKCYYRPMDYTGYEFVRCDGDYSDCIFDSALGLIKIPAVEQDGTVTLVYRKVQSSSEPSTAPAPTTTPKPTSTGSSSNFHSVNTYYSGTFYDVASSDWFDENVKRAYELGLMKGMSDTSFGPYSNVTVAQAVTLAARLHSIYYTGSENFVQSGNNWYDVYVTYARNNGILQNSYNYNNPISRGDFAYILAKALPAEALPAIDSDIYFDDVKSTTPYQSYIYLLAQAGIIRGVPNIFGTLDFQPNDSITRAQVAAIVTRMADPSLRQ